MANTHDDLMQILRSLIIGFNAINNTLISGFKQLLAALGKLDEDVLGIGETSGSNSSSAIPGKLGKFIDAGKVVYNAIVSAINKMKKWISESIAFAREISHLNATLASAFAISDIRKIFRDIRYGAITGASSAKLIKAVDDFKDAIVPIVSTIIIAFNEFAVWVLGLLTELRKIRNDVFDFALKILDAIPWFKELHDEIIKKIKEGDKPGSFAIQNFITDMASGNAERHRQPAFK